MALALLLVSVFALGSVGRSSGFGASRGGESSGSPQSWLSDSTLLTVYGRSFGTAPILGRLGMDRSFNDVQTQVRPYLSAIHSGTHGRVRVALHLIYALATPCTQPTTCLLYLDDVGVNIVRQYIQPAARRRWLVILDDQLGRSTPAGEMNRIIARGYLRFDNVQVAFDPEFRVRSGSLSPGNPVGSVTASELNDAAVMMNRQTANQALPHRKLMLVHQWDNSMIQNRNDLKLRLKFVEPVVVMDGFGPPDQKAENYSKLVGMQSRMLRRGIKLFPPNPYELAGHLDRPMLTWKQMFGHDPVLDTVSNRLFRFSPRPDVIVMT